MKKLALILATAAAFGLTSAAFAQGPAASTKEQARSTQTQSHVTPKMKTSPRRGGRLLVQGVAAHAGLIPTAALGGDLLVALDDLLGEGVVPLDECPHHVADL